MYLLSNPAQFFCSIKDKGAKSIIEIREVKSEAYEMYRKFIENQDALAKANQEVKKLRRGYDALDSWVKEKIERIQYERWEEKGRLGKVFLLILRYMFQKYKNQDSGVAAGPLGTT